MPFLNYSIIVMLLVLIAACSPPPEEAVSLESVPVPDADGRTALADESGLFQPGVAQELLDCQSHGAMTVHCGFRNPEDLVALPGGKHLVVSEMGEFLTDAPGTLSLLNLATGEREVLSV